jgi:putative hemolysin
MSMSCSRDATAPAAFGASSCAPDRPVSQATDSAGRNWLQGAFARTLTSCGENTPGWVAAAQRLFGFDELNALVAKVEASGRSDGLAALAEALDIRYEYDGLENLKAVGDRPVVLYANHPTGGGNVLGLTTLLASQFPDFRILGNQHMKFVRSLSEKMIAVDPFRSTAALNLESLVKLRREFGTQYQALGVFPAGISSRLHLSGLISDRRWCDAFMRIARHHNALLVPVWFSGRNRLRYYIAARVRAELGFLALPAEFLRLRGQTITARIGEPIEPDALSAIPNRKAQMNFLRAAVYELGRDGAPAAAGKKPFRAKSSRVVERPTAGAIALGRHLEMRFLDSAAAMGITEIARTAVTELADATYHVVVTPRGRSAPIAHWQVLDWRQFRDDELDEISPVRKAFRLPGDAARAGRNWLEIVSFGMPGKFRSLTAMRQIGAALHRTAALAHATDIVGIVTSQEKHIARVALQFARLQKTFTDAALLCAGATSALMGATRHHDWRPLRDVAGFERLTNRKWVAERMQPTAAMLARLAAIGFRFGAAGLTPDPAARPCVLARLSLSSFASGSFGLANPRRLLAAGIGDIV